MDQDQQGPHFPFSSVEKKSEMEYMQDNLDVIQSGDPRTGGFNLKHSSTIPSGSESTWMFQQKGIPVDLFLGFISLVTKIISSLSLQCISLPASSGQIKAEFQYNATGFHFPRLVHSFK